MFDETMITDIANFTNQRAFEHNRKWKPITMEEMKAFIGVMFYIAGCKQFCTLPELFDEEFGLPFVSCIFSLDRIKSILRFLRCDDKTKRDDLREKENIVGVATHELINKMNKNMTTIIKPGYFLCIDEKMEAFDGRAQGKMYNPDKPIKHGFEYILCCTRDPVICYSFIHYTGKKNLDPNEHVGKQLIELVIKDLPPNDYLLQTDSRFLSPHHVDDLLRKKNIRIK